MDPMQRKVLISELLKLRSRIEDLFEATAVQLFEQLDETDGVAAILAHASHIAVGEGHLRFKASIQRARHEASVLAEEYSVQVSGASEIKRGIRSIKALLEDLKREVRLAAMVATNAQTISRSIEGHQAELEHFALEVKDLLGQALTKIQMISSEMAGTDGSIAPLIKLSFRLREAIFRIEINSRALDALLQDLSSIEELPDALRNASSAQSQMSRALQKAVADLQGGDAARQRLDHVLYMLETQTDQCHEVDLAIEMLAREQVIGLAHTLASELASAQESTTVIVAARTAAADAVKALGSTGVAHTLAQISVALKQIDVDLDDIRKIALAIGPEVERLSRAFALSAQSIGTISALDAQMQILGINAILVARKVQKNGQAMTEVAKQLRECTSRIGSESKKVLRVTCEQERVATALGKSATEQKGCSQSAIGAVAREAEEIAKAYVEVVQHLLPTSDPFLPRLTTKLKEFGSYISSVSSQIEGYSIALDFPISSIVDASVIKGIRETYTMVAERDIHDRLFGKVYSGSNERSRFDEVDDDIFF